VGGWVGWGDAVVGGLQARLDVLSVVRALLGNCHVIVSCSLESAADCNSNRPHHSRPQPLSCSPAPTPNPTPTPTPPHPQTSQALEAAVKLSHRYIADRFMPDKV